MRETLLPAEASPDHRKVTWSRLRRAAAARFGVRDFRAGQMEIIEALFQGRDVFGVLPTGAGKSLCFQLPALFLPKPTIVVSPLIALMQDQEAHLASADVGVTRLDSTLAAPDERAARRVIAAGRSRLVYVTPERLARPEYLELLAKTGASLIVVDEAHCVSQWGHDFRPAYLALRHAIHALGRAPVVALTATATPQIRDDVVAQLGMQDPLVVNTGVLRRNLVFEVSRTPNEDVKRTRLMEILRGTSGAGIVYVSTIKLAEELSAWIRAGDVAVERYHGRLSAKERAEVQSRFMGGETRIMVATNAFGLGIDKPDLRFVVHYNFPDSLERYVQEAGRAGRDGERARAVLLYQLEDRRLHSFFLRGKYPSRADWERVVEALRAGPGSTLVEVPGVTRRHAQVVLAELESARIVRRKAGTLTLRARADAAALEHAIAAYEQRLEDDRERLKAMMSYAQSTRCRAQLVADYFAAAAEEPCGLCDNCRTDAPHALAS